MTAIGRLVTGPGDDFYRYANAVEMEAMVIPPDRTGATAGASAPGRQATTDAAKDTRSSRRWGVRERMGAGRVAASFAARVASFAERAAATPRR